MPFWLNPSIDPMNTDMEILSPHFALKGNDIRRLCTKSGLVIVLFIFILIKSFLVKAKKKDRIIK